MSDEDKDVDIESDEEDDEGGAASQPHTPADKRAHHNALERKRRDHIKDSFHSLRDSVPELQGEKVSRAQILKKAAEYIQAMRDKNCTHQKDIDDMKRANQQIQSQIKHLEKYADQSRIPERPKERSHPRYDDGRPVSESSDDDDINHSSRKKPKLAPDS